MKNIDIMGYLWRVSDKTFKRFLQAAASEDAAERDAATDIIGRNHQGRIYRCTDLAPDEAAQLLEDLYGKGPKP